jgi:toxin HigB-1
MNIEFATQDLQRLFEDVAYRPSHLGADVVKAYRKKVNFIIAALDERDLIGMRSLRYKRLTGDRAEQHSIRLNDQWRLILVPIDRNDGKTIYIIEIVDYH